MKHSHSLVVSKKFGGWSFNLSVWRGTELVYVYVTPPAYASESSARRGADRFVDALREALKGTAATVACEKKLGGWAFEFDLWRADNEDECIFSFVSPPVYAQKSGAERGAQRFLKALTEAFS